MKLFDLLLFYIFHFMDLQIFARGIIYDFSNVPPKVILQHKDCTVESKISK